MTSKRWVVAAIGFAVIMGACYKAPEFTAADEAIVTGMFDSTAVWFKARKFNEWSMEFAPDAFLQPPHGKTVTGRAGLVAWASALPPIEEMTFTNVKVSGEGSTAMGTSDFMLKPKDVSPDTGKQIVVFRRGADGKWAIIGGGFNSDLPPVITPPAPMKK